MPLRLLDFACDDELWWYFLEMDRGRVPSVSGPQFIVRLRCRMYHRCGVCKKHRYVFSHRATTSQLHGSYGQSRSDDDIADFEGLTQEDPYISCSDSENTIRRNMKWQMGRTCFEGSGPGEPAKLHPSPTGCVQGGECRTSCRTTSSSCSRASVSFKPQHFLFIQNHARHGDCATSYRYVVSRLDSDTTNNTYQNT